MSNTVQEKESQPFTLKLMLHALVMQNVCPNVPNLYLFCLTTLHYELYFNYGFYKHASTEEHSRIKRERLRDQKGENQGQNNIKA